MKKAFTLVELLVVVLVIVTLMAIVFRLSAIGSDATARSITVNRLQRLENCLSGYYAAFGSYPPVRLHNSRDFRLKTSDKHHVQSYDQYVEGSGLVWESVKAACMAQPVGCEFPFPPSWYDSVEAFSDAVVAEAEAAGKSASEVTFTADAKVSGAESKVEWREAQIFQFGLLSYLLPRYLFMLGYSSPGNANTGVDSDYYENYAQWTSNNAKPCDALEGSTLTWSRVSEYATSGDVQKIARVANIPSQAACARWISNLEGVLKTVDEWTFYGVTVSDPNDNSLSSSISSRIHGRGDYDNDNTSGQYVLAYIDIEDGWKNPFYYYSQAPYQGYVLWSGGANEKTFPPWVDRTRLDATARTMAEEWTSDDIVGMSN